MTDIADTRESLLIRLRDPQCDAAWQEFASIYRPMIYRLARQSGLQDCDAQDVSQRVLLSVSGAIGQWRKDHSKGKFRGWLTVVTRNAVCNVFTRSLRDQPPGGSEVRQLLENSGEKQTELDERIEMEFMRSVFREAANRVRKEFADSTWQAFWLTSVNQISISDAAQQLSTTPGAIYAARSRVMRRLQAVASTLSQEEGPK